MVDGATVERLEAWMGETGIAPGDRLPPERELSRILEVSRSELRKALTVLEIDGRLRRHVGRGTFLRTDPSSSRNEPALPIAADLAERTSPRDAMMARFALEPWLAGHAAVHASRKQLAEANRLAAKMRSAADWQTYERLDSEFHRAIASAAGNALLDELHRIIDQVRVSVVWARLDLPKDGPPPDYHSFAEHDAIVEALQNRDRLGAQEAMRAHLKSTRQTLLPED